MAARGPDVAHPLRLAAGCDQILGPVDGEQVDRRAAGLAGLTAGHLQDPGAQDADAQAGQQGHGRVEDMPGEPSGALVPISHGCLLEVWF